MLIGTPPEANIAPENEVSQKEFNLPTINFQEGYLLDIKVSNDTVDGRNPNNHLECIKPCKSWDFNYRPQLVNAGFQPSTVVSESYVRFPFVFCQAPQFFPEKNTRSWTVSTLKSGRVIFFFRGELLIFMGVASYTHSLYIIDTVDTPPGMSTYHHIPSGTQESRWVSCSPAGIWLLSWRVQQAIPHPLRNFSSRCAKPSLSQASQNMFKKHLPRR